MLHIGHLTASELLLEFNVDKSYGIAFGPNVGNLPSLCVGDKTLNWSSTVKYVSVHFVSGKHLSIDFDVVKREFYSAYNCVLSNSHCTNELIQLQLQESYCLPILTYAFPGLRVNASQIRELNVCWNSVYRKIFHYNRWESVKCCINGLGRMDSVHILAFQALKFWKSLMQSTNRTLYSIFMCFRRERDYMILLRTYNCTTTESIGILKSKVFEHYARTSICAAREVTG